MSTPSQVRIACVQTNVRFGKPEANARAAAKTLRELGDQGVQIAVFPEAFLTGYVVRTREEAESIAIFGAGPDPEQAEIDAQGAILGEGLDVLFEAALESDITVFVGFAEACDDGRLRNAVAVLEPGSMPRVVHKTHLPELGLDKFVDAGSSLEPVPTRFGRIGVFVCFDLRPPEPARVLSLLGARLLVLPTNWPVGAEFAPDFISPVRAAENKVFLATCNRVGKENGFEFIGRSGIYSPSGKTLAKAGPGVEKIIADIDLSEAENKRTTVIPGEYESEAFASRRPELYRPITRPLG